MKFKKAPLLAYLCLLPVLLTLGVWQLNRADEKRVALRLQDQQQSAEILELSGEIQEADKNIIYKNIHALGHFDDEHQFLLDNQVYKGRAGYIVLTPFRLKDANKAVLVNRGWLPVGNNRSDLPDVKVEGGEISITGRINHFPRVGMKLEGAEIPADNWPAVVQVIDINVLSKLLAYPLVNFQIELDKLSPNGYTREWQEASSMTPEKHRAYAVQWFLLALTLTVLFVKYGITKNHD